jgi:acetyl esterase
MPGGAPIALLVYFHGGGWVFGELDDCDSMCRSLAQGSGCALLSVGYRLAPEHPFPAAVDDALAVTAWAHERPWPWASRRLIVVGDSAGGNLAAVVSLLMRDAGSRAINGQILIYPVTCADMNFPTFTQFADGPTVGADAMRWFWHHYVADTSKRRDFRAAPLYASNHSGLPPALVITAEYDPLRDEGEAYATALERARVPVQLHRYPSVPHGFFTMTGLIDEAALAIGESAQWVRNLVGIDSPAL